MMSGPLKALLGVLAVAGYQNRDKIGELLRQVQTSQRDGGPSPSDGDRDQQNGGLGGLFGSSGGFSDLLSGLSTSGILSGGLADLLKTFQQNGHLEKAESWVRTGPNTEIDGSQLSEALGPGILDELASKTGLSQQEIVDRLSRHLPTAVDDLTPDGRVPEADNGVTSSAGGTSRTGPTSIT